MSKRMHEYAGDVTITLRRRWTEYASDEAAFIQRVKRLIEHYEGLNELNEGDIKDIEIENVERVDDDTST